LLTAARLVAKTDCLFEKPQRFVARERFDYGGDRGVGAFQENDLAGCAFKSALYPQIAKDYEHMFAVLKSLPCDVFLGAHGNYYGLEAKYPRLGHGENPFIDPEGYKSYVAEREHAFREELNKQSKQEP